MEGFRPMREQSDTLRERAAQLRALVAGDWQALRLLPRMLRKRSEVRRRLSPAEVRRLILANRLTLREVA